MKQSSSKPLWNTQCLGEFHSDSNTVTEPRLPMVRPPMIQLLWLTLMVNDFIQFIRDRRHRGIMSVLHRTSTCYRNYKSQFHSRLKRNSIQVGYFYISDSCNILAAVKSAEWITLNTGWVNVKVYGENKGVLSLLYLINQRFSIFDAPLYI